MPPLSGKGSIDGGPGDSLMDDGAGRGTKEKGYDWGGFDTATRRLRTRMSCQIRIMVPSPASEHESSSGVDSATTVNQIADRGQLKVTHTFRGTG